MLVATEGYNMHPAKPSRAGLTRAKDEMVELWP